MNCIAGLRATVFIFVLTFHHCGRSQAIEATDLRLSAILHDSVELFVQPTTCASVTQWTLQYRKIGPDVFGYSTKQLSSSYYATKITGLTPNTQYQIRVFASQLHGKTNLTQSEVEEQDWTKALTFRTDFPSVFGRITLRDKSHADKLARGVDESSYMLKLIEDAYRNKSYTLKGITIIQTQIDKQGKAVVHYRIKVDDTKLPSEYNYTISGEEFTESYINNGDVANGTPYIIKKLGRNKWILKYQSNGNCATLVERFMRVSPDNENSTEVHLNIADSSSTTTEEEDGMDIKMDGNLIGDDGLSFRKLTQDTLVILSPKFLVLDCLKNQSVSLYSEIFGGRHFGTGEWIDTIYEYIPLANLDVESPNIKHRRERKTATFYVSPIPMATKIEVLENGVVRGEASGEDVNCQGETIIVVNDLIPERSYRFSFRATIRNKVGKQASVLLNRDVFVKATECGVPPVSSYLKLRKAKRKGIAYFYCCCGAQLQGKSYSVCKQDGNWTGIPTCERVKFCAAPIAKNLRQSMQSRRVFRGGERIEHSCRRGYTLHGNNTAICIGPHWDKPTPRCSPNICRAPAMPDHCSSEGRKRLWRTGDNIFFDCEPGYKRKGSRFAKCLINGTWSASPPSCIKKRTYCEIPKRLRHFSVLLPRKPYYNESEVVRYHCSRGSFPIGKWSSKCLANGKWSSSFPVCKRIVVRCTASRLIQYPVHPERFYDVGYTFVFGCPYGYRMSGPDTSECLSTGFWSNPRPLCLPFYRFEYGRRKDNRYWGN